MKNLLLLLVPFYCFAQQTQVVDFKRIAATVAPKEASQSISGTVKVSFTMLKDADSVYLDAKQMAVTNQALESVGVRAASDKLWLVGPFVKDRSYNAFFAYQASPKQTLYFTGEQIWTQGQGKYTSHWLPSLDDMNDKIEFDLTVMAPKNKSVIANGKLIAVDNLGDTIRFSYDMEKPMSSYLVAFAIGDFQKKTMRASSGIPIELYIDAKDSLRFEPTYRYTQTLFDFLESEIGIPFPWQNYKQVPVRDFLYAGMENTTLTIFSEAFVVDSIGFNDRNYVNVNAHELAHQWFGNLVTETSGTHHWLQEGFATYYALLAEREIFGEDYYYWKLYNSAEQLKTLSEEGKGQSLLDPKATSLVFYEKGAWALHMLKELIGAADFKKAVQNYLETHKYKNVRTADFLNEVRNVSQIDISQWEKDWLYQTAFKAEDAFNSLMRSNFMKRYFEMARLAPLPLKEKKVQLTTALTFPDDFIGQEAIRQLSDEPIEAAIPLYRKGLESNNLYIRQAVANVLLEVPESLRSLFETLLTDPSYLTQESALYTLWYNFPLERARYLDMLDGAVGFQDKGLRQLWLALAINTDRYQDRRKDAYIEELRGYTSSSFSFEVREKAFSWINNLGLYNDQVIRNLVNASVHHNWRFRSTSRSLLDEVLKNPGTKKALLNDLSQFSTAEQAYLNRINSEK